MPEEIDFRTKPQLARVMVERAVEGGVPFGWVAGDTVYGSDRKLRQWLEQQEIPHVLAVKSNEQLWALTDKGSRQSLPPRRRGCGRTGWRLGWKNRAGSG